ncbi:MAG: ABC transporter permease [Rhodothermales bacterium]
MLNNYLKIAFRQLWRHRGQTVINMAGLALGMACCLLIARYIQDDLSFDRFNAHAADIYRVHVRDDNEVTPTIVAPLAVRAIPGVEAAARLYNIGSFQDVVVRRGDRQFLESRFFYADSSVFDVFTFPLQAGVVGLALNRPNTVVLTAPMAEKYFGDEDPVGQRLTIGSREYEVTGVLAPIPETSHLQFDFLGSFATTHWATEEIWGSANFLTYLRLRPGTDPQRVQATLDNLVAEAREAGEVEPDYRLGLQPLLGIYLDVEGHRTYVYLLGTIGLLLLVIASVNYVNLSTARAAYRAREVGIRKVAGANRNQLFWQFLGESMVLATLSLALGVALAAACMPTFNGIAGKNLTLWGNAATWAAMVGVVVVVGVAGGSYPALLLASFKPAGILKRAVSSSGSGWLRRGLVIFQFAATVVLLVATVVVSGQLRFVQTADLGFDREHVVALPIPVGDPATQRAYEPMREAMLQLRSVAGVAAVNHLPGYQRGGYGLRIEGGDETIAIGGVPSDAHVVETLGLHLVAGPGLRPVRSDSITSGSYQYLLNEKAVQAAGWTPDEAIGKRVALSGNRWGTVAGVIADYHYLSLRETIEPLAYFVEPWGCNFIVVRIAPGSTADALAGIEAAWTTWMPDRPFAFSFLDAELEKLYRSEERAGQVFGLSSILAVLIACMGLFGLAAFSAARRTKEIGIRKVLGASVAQLVVLMSSEFSLLVAASFCLGAPVAYLLMRQWLKAFAYQIPLSWTLFAAVGAGVLLLAGLTVSYQAIRTALADPVESLRYE